MKKFEYPITINNKFILENFKNSIILDIETTGLSRQKDTIIILGLLEIEKFAKIKIYFAENLKEEVDLLLNLNVDNRKLITYNGNRFDLPFIKNKEQFYSIKTSSYVSFDLYDYIKKYKYLLNLDSYKQKNIEKFLGYERDEFISGAELIKNYKNYLKTRDDDLLNSIINHNKDDVTGLLKSLEIINFIKKLLTVEVEGYNFIIEDLSFSNNLLIIKGTTNCPFTCEVNSFNHSFYLKENIFNINILTYENKYDEGLICRYILSEDFNNIKDVSNIPSPDKVYLLYLKDFIFHNVKKLVMDIIEDTFKNIKLY
ncbi:ribonuclease H-like domain-containing protein [Peptoniphilus catoniae]|uniref:ribonuclease H-like domain-containing protein n=1 Tax=Peptoniphilus catoniae TaxID=1660341 RepID=UPI0015D5E184|nr:ribonuclease H-like domain-containing protein [Peptoniphilus catoniae]